MLGDRLKEIREERKVTQEEMATFLGIKRQSYSNYERNASIPDAITLGKIADYLDTSCDYLLGKYDDKKSITAIKEAAMLRKVFIESGIIKDGEDLTPEQLNNVIRKLGLVIAILKDEFGQ